uniref:Chlororespiratory reduction31 n=1 Tax=Apostasia odorata TaxID=280455 RepID=A0A0F7CYV1_9ASPA
MAASSVPIQFEPTRNRISRCRSPFLSRKTPSILHFSPRSAKLKAPSAKFNLFELLGGRGLCNGERGLEKELNSFVAEDPVTATPAAADSPSSSPSSYIAGDGAFDKQLMGLTGGFPGGERGLQRFIERNPPPSKKTGAVEEHLGTLIHGSRPKPPDLPLLMPGMIVIVKNPANPFYMYSGIVQRVTDGRAGVLFEGGNWDKLLTFRLHELERRDKGPPMVNPKSAVLESLVDFPNPE